MNGLQRITSQPNNQLFHSNGNFDSSAQHERISHVSKESLQNQEKEEKVVSLKELRETNSIQCLNALSADLVELVSSVMLEKIFFQNNKISLQFLLYLANDVIKNLAPKKNETLSITKDLGLMWKQLLGKELSEEEQIYLNLPIEIDPMREFFNGITCAFVGHNLFTSVTSALQKQLGNHVPWIVGYSGTVLLGPQCIAFAVDRVLQSSGLNQIQKNLIKPWLNTVARLVTLGLLPKVHANEHGVHYHFPSTEGSMQVFSEGQLLTFQGEKLTIEREGQLEMPEGTTFEGVYYSEFKLGSVQELSEQRIRIQVYNKEGKKVPVEFIKVQGIYGPEIQIKSDDKLLEQYWLQQFRPKEKTHPKSDPTDVTCISGLTAGALASLSMTNVIPLAMGTLACLQSVRAVNPSVQEIDGLQNMFKEFGLVGVLKGIHTVKHPGSINLYLELFVLQQLAVRCTEEARKSWLTTVKGFDGLKREVLNPRYSKSDWPLFPFVWEKKTTHNKIEQLIEQGEFWNALYECETIIDKGNSPEEIHYYVMSIAYELLSEAKLTKISKLIENKDFVEALIACETTIQKCNGNPPFEVYYYKGKILMELGNFREADKSFNFLNYGVSNLINLEMKKKDDLINEYIKNPKDIKFRNIFLKNIGMTIPTHYEYIAMSVLVYFFNTTDKQSNPKSIPEKMMDHWNLLKTKGWELGESSDELGITDNAYFGIAFINKTTRHIIISHRSSVFLRSENEKQIINDQIRAQHELARLFVEKIAEMYKEYVPSHTGHSGGAALAEYLSFSRNEMAVTVDSPGIEHWFTNQNSQTKIENMRSISYFSAPHMFNATAHHVGEMRTISTAVDSESQDLSTILDAFDYERGYPRQFQLVRKWPYGFGEKIQFDTFCKNHNLDPAQPNPSFNKDAELEQIYNTEVLKQGRMKLSLMSLEAQKMLKKYCDQCKYLSNFNPHILKLFYIEGDEIIMRGDNEIFTIEDFKNYVEYKMVEAEKHQAKWMIDPSRRCQVAQPVLGKRLQYSPKVAHLKLSSFSEAAQEVLRNYKKYYAIIDPHVLKEEDIGTETILARCDKDFFTEEDFKNYIEAVTRFINKNPFISDNFRGWGAFLPIGAFRFLFKYKKPNFDDETSSSKENTDNLDPIKLYNSIGRRKDEL